MAEARHPWLRQFVESAPLDALRDHLLQRGENGLVGVFVPVLRIADVDAPAVDADGADRPAAPDEQIDGFVAAYSHKNIFFSDSAPISDLHF